MKHLLNKIMLEDCFEFIPKLTDSSIDLAIIDPPYNMNKGKWDEFQDDENFFKFTEKWIEMLIPKMNDDGSLYVFNNPFNAAFILRMLLNSGMIFKNWITWHKQDGIAAAKSKYTCHQETILFFTKSESYYFNHDAVRQPYKSKSRIEYAKEKGILKNGKRWFPNPNGSLCGDVWSFSSHRHNNKVNGKTTKQNHPTPKPEALIERMIIASSQENDLVLDLFSGSGTTAAMCVKSKRNFVGCESLKIFHEFIIQRINDANSKYK